MRHRAALPKPTLNAVTDLHKASADVVEMCQAVLFGHGREVTVALRQLPARLSWLAIRIEQAQAALQEDRA